MFNSSAPVNTCFQLRQTHVVCIPISGFERHKLHTHDGRGLRSARQTQDAESCRQHSHNYMRQTGCSHGQHTTAGREQCPCSTHMQATTCHIQMQSAQLPTAFDHVWLCVDVQLLPHFQRVAALHHPAWEHNQNRQEQSPHVGFRTLRDNPASPAALTTFPRLQPAPFTSTKNGA